VVDRHGRLDLELVADRPNGRGELQRHDVSRRFETTDHVQDLGATAARSSPSNPSLPDF
jgi:hypothetical protein